MDRRDLTRALVLKRKIFKGKVVTLGSFWILVFPSQITAPLQARLYELDWPFHILTINTPLSLCPGHILLVHHLAHPVLSLLSSTLRLVTRHRLAVPNC